MRRHGNATAETARKISNVLRSDCSNGGEEALLRTLEHGPPIFEEGHGTSCNRHAAATAQIKQIRKCTQVEDSQQLCVWWRKLTCCWPRPNHIDVVEDAEQPRGATLPMSAIHLPSNSKCGSAAERPKLTPSSEPTPGRKGPSTDSTKLPAKGLILWT